MAKSEPTPKQGHCHKTGCSHTSPQKAYKAGKECGERDKRLGRYSARVSSDSAFNADWRRGYLEAGR